MKTKNIKTIQYSDQCPVCHKTIIGTSESQVKYNLKVHAMQIHGVEIRKEVKGDDK